MLKDNGRLKSEEGKEKYNIKTRATFCPKCEKITFLKATFGKHSCSNCGYEFTSGNMTTGKLK